MSETINLMKKTKAQMIHIIFCQIQEKNKLDEKVKEYAGEIYDMKNIYKEFIQLKEENEKLKEENQKIQEHLDKAREVSNNLIAQNNTTMPSQSALYRENKKLNLQLKSWERWGGEITNELIVMEEWEHYVNKGLLKDSKGAGIEINLT